MENHRRQVLAAVVVSALCVGVGLAVARPTSYTLRAARVGRLPRLDGLRDNDWRTVEPIRVPLRGSVSRVPWVDMRALHDGEDICVLLEWPDPDESMDRTPWEFDGSEWRQLPAAEFYEDKAAFYWPITEVTEFRAVGCSATCHFGGGKSGRLHKETGWPGGLNVGAHYAIGEGQRLDEWHWKAARTNPYGQADDAYVNGDRPTPEHETGGRQADEPKETAGGYRDNVTEDGSRPLFEHGSEAGQDRRVLKAIQAFPIDDYGKYKPGDRLPGLMLAPLLGNRADIGAAGQWSDGMWTLEVRRRLSTGDPNDVDFSDTSQRYPFGVAIFNAQQFEHSYSVCVQWLELE